MGRLFGSGPRRVTLSAKLQVTDRPFLCGRYEEYVDQHYKEYLKDQGKVDSVRWNLEREEGKRHRQII